MDERTITRLLAAWREGDRGAFDRLAPCVYDEMRQLAASYVRRERAGLTLDTGGLAHEAFLRLAGQRRVAWQNRSHFFGIAALLMRRVLIERARARGTARRGQGALHLPLADAADLAVDTPPELALLDEALRRLGEHYPDAGKVVELRFFGGLSEQEIGDALGISVPTVKRRWRLARAWLHRHLAASA